MTKQTQACVKNKPCVLPSWLSRLLLQCPPGCVQFSLVAKIGLENPLRTKSAGSGGICPKAPVQRSTISSKVRPFADSVPSTKSISLCAKRRVSNNAAPSGLRRTTFLTFLRNGASSRPSPPVRPPCFMYICINMITCAYIIYSKCLQLKR